MLNFRLLAMLLLLTGLALFSLQCRGNRGFRRGVKAYERKADRRADRIMERYLDHPKYGPGAALVLLDMQTRRARSLQELAAANRAYDTLFLRYDTLPKAQLKALRKQRVGKGKVLGKQASIQRKAIRIGAKGDNVLLLDTINRHFPNFQKRLRPQWADARRDVVKKYLRTKDYDIATSILNNHLDVVDQKDTRSIWVLRDSIWRYFKDKYPLCEIDRFRADHPRHVVSKDCWHAEAKAVFCSGSLAQALDFQKRYPYSAFEVEVMFFALELAESGQGGDLSPEQRGYLTAMRRYANLLLTASPCSIYNNKDIYEDLTAILPRFAPRLGAYRLLMDGTAYLFHNNQDSNAVRLLRQMRPLFPDTSVCLIADYDFQVNKLPRVDSCLQCLSRGSAPVLNYSPFNAVNTGRFMEYGAVSWDEGHEVYFARRLAKSKVAVMRTFNDGKGWSVPEEDATLSVNRIAAPMSMTADGLQMLLKVGTALYVAQRSTPEAPWNAPIRLPIKMKRLKRAVFAPDGKALVLEATLGKTTLFSFAESDLYYSTLDDNGVFSKPRSLGTPINSAQKESNPYLAADGKTLYFSSEREENGYGNMDVYITRRKGIGWDAWTTPQNLGCQVNTRHNDYTYTWIPEDGKAAFYTFVNPCSRDRNIHTGDLPAFARPNPLTHLRGQVLNTKGKPIRKGYVMVQLDDSTQLKSVAVNAMGQYHYKLPLGTQKVRIYPNITGYFNTRDTTYQLQGRSPGTTFRDTFVLLTSGEMRKPYTLRYARFAAGSSTPNDPRLNKELEFLQLYAGRLKAKIKLVAYTDAAQSDDLCVARAEEVKKILVEKFGAVAVRITTASGDNSQPKCPGKDPAAQRCNNRVEVHLELPPPQEVKRIEDEAAQAAQQQSQKYDTKKVVQSDEETVEEIVEEETGAVLTKKQRRTWVGRTWEKLTGRVRYEKQEGTKKKVVKTTKKKVEKKEQKEETEDDDDE